MRWIVEAVDSRTGLDTEMTVEALTATEAERLARYNGLPVANVYKHRFAGKLRWVPPVVAYAPPKPAGPPSYAQLLRDARWVRRLGQGISVLGWVGVFAAAAWFAFLATRAGAAHWKDWRGWLLSPAREALPCALAGAGCVAVGSIMRLLGIIGLAMRDVARNTFCPTGAESGPDDGPADAMAGAAQL